MPVYEYRCKACGRTSEIEHGFHDERPTTCPHCGGQLARVFHPVGVVFKGSGFHKTDYTASGVRKDAKTGDAAAQKTGSGETAATDGKPAAEKKAAPESKPATGSKKPEAGSAS
jgi:putative FmdB family regulatory protein